MKQKRNITYINKDFAGFRQQLINYAKTYFRNTINDFNESDPAMMFIETSAVVGDVLSFYNDVQLQESFMSSAEERINLYNLAQQHGYKVKSVIPASVDLDVFQLLPAKGIGSETKPDFRYGLVINNIECSTTDINPVHFRSLESVDFRHSSSFNPTEISVYSVTDDGNVEYYLLKKTIRAVSGQVVEKEFEFTTPKIYDKIVLTDTNVSNIISIIDSDDKTWYEVPFLAQDTIPLGIHNSEYNNSEFSIYRNDTPYLLCYKQTERRFVTRLRKDDTFEIQFGAGLSTENDEEIIPNPTNIGAGLAYFERVTDASLDPDNFLYTRTYGLAPQNTTLTVKYAISNGITDNVTANTITRINNISIEDPIDIVDNVLLNTIKDSVAINNPYPAYGALSKKSMDVIREEAIANFAAQNRAVTKEDYIMRCYTLPSKYGSISKAYIVQDTQISRWNEYDRIPNQLALNLYVLSYDANRNFVKCNPATKHNLQNYLGEYRLLTDAINIKDPFIVNIGIDVELITYPNENSNEVILKALNKLIELFDNDKRNINEPIIISKIRTELDKLDGVQTVTNITFTNLVDINSGYSGIIYNVTDAIREGILYPSVDPMIFEIKYPKRDIKVRVVE